MFANKRKINGKTYYYLEHSYRLGNKVQKVYFKFSKAPKFSLNDFIASNKEALEQFAKKRAEHIKKNLGFSRFFEYGAQLETIEKGRVLFQIFIKSIDKTTEEGIISEYLRKFTVN